MRAVDDADNSAPELYAKRLVVFVGGFDPRSAGYYHRLCAGQAALQGQVDGRKYEVSRRSILNIQGDAGVSHLHAQWTVQDANAGSSRYVFFDWSSQVRAHWHRSLWRVLFEAVSTYGLVLLHWKVLQRVKAAAPNTLLSFIYPPFLMMLCCLLAIACGVASAKAVLHVASSSVLMQYGIAGVTAVLGFGMFALLDRRLHVSWLLRIFTFARTCAEESDVLMDDRVQAMASWIARQQAANPMVEVVVLGFSVGSVKSLALLQAWKKACVDLQNTRQPSLTFITLGNCIPLFSLMPGARQVQTMLHEVGNESRIYWVDISSPGDSVSFAMCDLHQLSSQDKQGMSTYLNPRVMCSPRFHTLFSKATYRWMRPNKMRMHFQYLMASEKPGAYNFYSMLTGIFTVRSFVEKYLSR